MQASSVMMQESIREPSLKDYVDTILKRRNIAITFFIVVVSLAAIRNIMAPDIYEGRAQILLQEPIKPMVTIPEFQQPFYGSTYYASQIEIMKSLSIASSVVEKLDLISKYPHIVSQDPKTAAKIVRGMTNIKQIGDTRLFDVITRSANPNLSAEIANGLVDEYIEKNITATLLSSTDIMKKWFPENDGKIKFETIYGKLKELSRDEIVQTFPPVVKNPKIIELKTKKENLERTLAEYKKKYTDKHPKIIATNKEIQLTRDAIKDTSNNIVNEIKNAMSGRFQTSNVKVIEYAEVPQGPVGPKRVKNFLLISVMALFGGFGLAIFVDYLDNTVKTQDDVERHVQLPYLGYVPMIKEKPDQTKNALSDYIVVNPNEHKSNLLEALRNIRTSIIFSAPPDTLKSILIASALPKEGKSTISLNLAIAISSDGSRTLLVDGDMRRPNLHKMLGVKNAFGLSNYLTSKISLDNVIQDTKFSNLKFIPCGPIPPNPSELFGSYRMKELLDEAKQRFDRILFDGAPIFGISDSVVLAKSLDGVIQVIRFGKVPWDVANKSKQRLQDLGVKITGVIINGVEMRKESYYYKYYDYRYHKYYE